IKKPSLFYVNFKIKVDNFCFIFELFRQKSMFDFFINLIKF
ncbi:hypothetical protein AAJ76_2710002576, partial [Vairimorpha ceranae]